MTELSKLVAFFHRDMTIAASYRVSFFTNLVTVCFGLASMDFLARLINAGHSPALAVYGNDYFAYSLVGLAIAFCVQSLSSLFPSAIRTAQQTGTLEVIMASRTCLATFLVGSTLYGVAFALFRLVVIFLLGSLVFGAHFAPGQTPVAALAFILTVAIFAGIGIFGAAFVLLFKQSEPFTGAFISASFLLSGVLYPTSVLPYWLERLSPALPLTHTTDALRATLLQDAGIASIVDQLLILTAFALILPASLLVFSFCVNRARVDGSLGHY
jgi:ABC-2 type transport system permease protein